MFHRPRIIPVVSMIGHDMVKTVRFARPRYLGDPVNAVRIFNGKDVDELCILDIRASLGRSGPDFDYLRDIAGEAFMPLSYGGGITNADEIHRLFRIGYEKVILGTAFFENPALVTEAAAFAGSQSVVVCLDPRRDLFGRVRCTTRSGTVRGGSDPADAARLAASLGAGEILLNSVDCDGRMTGYDLTLVRRVSEAVHIPVTACGGAGKTDDLTAVLDAGAHAAAAGSLFSYYGTNRAVLINVPTVEAFRAAGVYKD